MPDVPPDPPVKRRRGERGPGRRLAKVPVPKPLKGSPKPKLRKIAAQARSTVPPPPAPPDDVIPGNSPGKNAYLKVRGPAGSYVALKELFGEHRLRAVRQISLLATKSRDENMRFAASKYILDRTDGAIPREVTGPQGAPLIPASGPRPSLAELLGVAVVAAVGVQEAAKAAAADETTIEGNSEHADDDANGKTG